MGRIRAAWETRDEAVERKNEAEVELARCRIESMQVSSQLLEAVQQKVVLSTQLEEWEGDLQNALHSQMSERIESSSRKSSDDERSSGGEGRRLSKILSFFSR